MEEQQKSIDEIFRQSLGDYREAPPAAAWEKVAVRLDNDGGSRRSYFLRWPWISLLLLLLVGGVWFIAAQYGGNTDANKLSKTVPVADNTEKVTTAHDEPAHDTSSGKSENIAGVLPSSNTKDKGRNDNSANATEQKAAIRRESKDNKATKDAAKTTNSDPIAAKQPTPTTGQMHRTRRTQRGQSGSTQKEAVTAQTRDSVIENAHDPLMNKKASVREPKVAKAKSTHRPQAANAIVVSRKASVRKSAVKQSSSSGEIAQAAAPAKDKPVKPSENREEASKKAPAARREAEQNRYAASASAAKVASRSSAKEEPAQSAEKARNKREKKTSPSPAQPKQTPYAAKVPAAKNASALTEPTAKKRSSVQAAIGKKKALTPEEAEKSAQTQSPERAVNSASKKTETPKAAKEKLAKQRVAAADKHTKPAVKAEAADRSTVKRQAPDTAEKAGRRKSAKQRPSSFTSKTLAPEKPVPASKKPEQITPEKEPAVGKWQPMAATPTQPATAAGNNKEESTEAEDKTDEAGGGSGAGGAAASSKARKKTSFSLAALGGYEFGLQQPAPNNITGAFRFLWHFDPGIAVGILPAFRYGNVSTTSLSSPTSYQRSSIRVDSVIRLDSNNLVNYRLYNVSQTFDSIVVFGMSAGGTMWQIELPLILSYKIAQAWHLYGGASVNFGGKLGATSGSMQTFTSSRSDSVTGPGGSLQPPRTVASFEGYFGKSALPDISTYLPANSVLTDPATVRFGYLFGLGYERKRIIIDASMHQQVSGYKDVEKALQKVYSSPHIRLSVGYILFPQKNIRRNTAE